MDVYTRLFIRGIAHYLAKLYWQGKLKELEVKRGECLKIYVKRRDGVVDLIVI